MKPKNYIWINGILALAAACNAAHANPGMQGDQGASAPASAARTNDSISTQRLGPKAAAAYPSTVAEVLSNLLYIVEHDLCLRDNFYQPTTQKYLLGAEEFLETPQSPDENALSFSLRSAPNREKTHGFAGSSVLVRRSRRNNGKIVTAVIDVQILDPIVQRPTYDEIATLVDRRWKPTVVLHRTVPLGKSVLPSYSIVSHGDADMTLAIRTPKAQSTLEFVFDSSAKLHALFVITHQNSRRE